VGTAAELVTAPATDYVRDFTRDINRARLVAVGSLIGERSGPTPGPQPVPAEARLETVIPRLVASDAPVPVIDGEGRYLGDLDRDRARDLLADGPTPESNH
jgi:glycine betaine/proline transport system ATP-binding protein